VLPEPLSVGSDDACGFLPAMLQSMKAEVGEFLRLGVGMDGDDSAFIMKFVRNHHWHWPHPELSS
jgi:hypothetical protein